MTSTKIIIGNWKMNGQLASNALLLSGLKQAIQALPPTTAKSRVVGLCAPFPYLSQVQEALQNTSIYWGAQNLSEHKVGAYTGEVSAAMLRDFGCSLVLVGHSERRSLYGESADLVAKKTASALAEGLIPVLCVGETLAEREAHQTTQVVLAQVKAVVDRCGIEAFGNPFESAEKTAKIMIAYEPVWAIGTGQTASPEQAQEVHKSIRQFLAAINPQVAQACPILYGGSVKSDNAKALLAMPDINGGLIGGAALQTESFMGIITA